MVTILISSLSEGAGKTAVCTGIGKELIKQNKKVGYMRPTIGVPPNNGDANFMKYTLNLDEPVDILCPSFTSEDQFAIDFQKSLDRIASGKDIILVECPRISNIKGLPAKVIPVVTYEELIGDKVTSAYQSTGEQITGVVINKVPFSQLNHVRNEATVNLGKTGITVLGILPEDRMLLTFSVAEIAELLDGQILNNPDKTGELAAGIMLGAMTVDSALPYFNRISNKVAVIRSERPDMQMAALQTSTCALVLSGTSPMFPQVKNLTEDKMVPVITTVYDVATVAQRMEDAIVKTKFHQSSKVAHMTELMTQGFDLQLLSRATSI